MYDSCETIATECGPFNVIGWSATDFRTMSVTGSPKPNWPWKTHMSGGDDNCGIYPRAIVFRSGALPIRTSKRRSCGSLESQGKFNAIWPLLA